MKKEDAKVVAYEAPTSVTLELLAEGVLCESNSAANGYGSNDLGEI